MSKFQNAIIAADIRANQPAAASVIIGSIYCVTDEGNILERSNGTTWDAYSPTTVGGDVAGPGSSTDNAIARFSGTSGKIIQDSTPLVEDDGRISTVTDPTGLTDVATKGYVDAEIAAVNVGGAAQNSFLVSGGQVAWVEDYDFLISAAVYFVNGVQYTSPESSVTLDTADPSDDRIDVIAVDDTGTVIKVTGTASTPASEPDIDPGSQLKLALVFVGAATTQPTVDTEVLYFENAGSPGEWDWTEVGTSFDPNSTNNPKSPATKDIEVTSAVAGDYAQGQIGTGTYDPNDARLLILYIRSKATWANKRGLTVSLRSAGVLIGSSVDINRSGSFGFDSSITGVYQLVAIPITAFAVPVGQTITQIRITAFGAGHGCYIGDLTFQEDGASQVPVGITQEQADALYASRTLPFVTLSNVTGQLPQSRQLVAGDHITFDTGMPGELELNVSGLSVAVGLVIDGGGSVITTGVKGFVSVPFAGTITAVTVLSTDASATAGDIVVDIWKDTYANYPPTDADSITASAPPTLSGANKSQDTTLTGWTTSVSAGDILGFNVDSVATVTRVAVILSVLRS